jgi:hypothetical protein
VTENVKFNLSKLLKMNENENTAVVWDNRKPLTARGFAGFWYTGGTVAYFFL